MKRSMPCVGGRRAVPPRSPGTARSPQAGTGNRSPGHRARPGCRPPGLPPPAGAEPIACQGDQPGRVPGSPLLVPVSFVDVDDPHGPGVSCSHIRAGSVVIHTSIGWQLRTSGGIPFHIHTFQHFRIQRSALPRHHWGGRGGHGNCIPFHIPAFPHSAFPHSAFSVQRSALSLPEAPETHRTLRQVPGPGRREGHHQAAVALAWSLGTLLPSVPTATTRKL